MDAVAALLLVLVLPATGFNMDAAHPSVWHVDAENFGYKVDIINDSRGEFSLLVATTRPRVPRTGNRVDVTKWFQCSVKDNNDTCKPDDKFTQGDPPSNDQGISLRTSWNGNEKRIFEFGLRDTGGLKVVVYAHGSDKQRMWSSEALEPGSSYGQPWCVTDLNSDGSDDLLVGEHLYNHNNTERGRVFVHVGQQQGVFNTSIIMGDDSSGGALFGSSISCIGDVDQDGFQDIAVGAPGEPGGGAIYIFRGSQAGIDPHYSQRISAADVDSKNAGITGFGMSISEGADVDNNNYNDLAVGASGSKHVVLLRARPVVQLHACLHASASELSNQTDTFNVSYVINFTAVHDQPTIDVEVVLRADPILCAAASDTPGACKPGDQLLNQTRTLSKNTNTSGVVLVALKRGVQLSPKPIEVKLDYKLVENSVSEFFKTKPVADPKVLAEQLLKINHTLSCETHTCRTQLKLRAELDNISRGAAEEGKTVKVKVSVESLKEPAFLTTLVLKAAPRLPLVGDKPHCRDNSTPFTTRLECDVANPLTSGDGPKMLFLELDLKEVPSSIDVLKLNFSVASAGEEETHSDNEQILEVHPNFRNTGEALTTSTSTASQMLRISTSKWSLAVGVVGGIVLCVLLAVVVFTVVKRRSFAPWKKSVFYRKIVAAESECSLSGATQELCSIENEYYDNIEEGNTHLRLRII